MTDVDVNAYLQTTDTTIKEKAVLLKSITDQVAGLRKQMDELVKMKLAGDMTRELFLEYHRPLEEQWVTLQEQIPILEGELDYLKVQYLSSDTILQEVKNLYHRWPSMEQEERRTVVEVITESVKVGKEDIHIKLAYVPSAFQNDGNRQNLF
jgi:hypothetical protein